MATVTSISKQRVDWIDTAKGFCIMLVVFNHVFCYYGPKEECPPAIYNFFDAFRMPLYFFLSGLFFKTYGSFGNFAKKKTNKLIIPFVFFYVVSCPIRVFFNKISSVEHSFADYLLSFYYNHCGLVNGPLWFLLCLFEVNLIFFLLHIIFKKEYLLLVLSFMIGLFGLMLSYYELQLPMTLATAFTCLPFFSTGFFVRNHTKILYESKVDSYLKPLALVCGLICFFFAGTVLYVENSFDQTSYFTAHLCGIAGTLMVFFISKIVGPLPVVTYIGRYSIVILCTHIFVVKTFLVVLRISSLSLNFFLLFIIVMLIELALVPVMIKYLPHVTAQKDLI